MSFNNILILTSHYRENTTMAIKPKGPTGIQRVSESDMARTFNKSEFTSKMGKTCQGCDKYFSYLRNEKFCIECSKRRRNLSN